MSTRLNIDRALSIYLDYAPGLSDGRRKNLASVVRHWKRASKPDGTPLPSLLARITTADFNAFRVYGQTVAKLANTTIEDHLNCLKAILRHCGPEDPNRCPHGLGLIPKVPWIGRRLPRPQSTPKPAVSLDDLSKVYRAAHRLTSHRDHLRKIPAKTLLRVYLVLAFNTGLRASDLVSMKWSAYDVRTKKLNVVASKTGKRHVFPVTDVLARHLAMLPRFDEFVFSDQLNAELVAYRIQSLCRAIGIPTFTPQSIRRRAGTEFDRAHPGSGGLLLGHFLGLMTYRNYIDPFELLLKASRKVAQPRAFRVKG